MAIRKRAESGLISSTGNSVQSYRVGKLTGNICVFASGRSSDKIYDDEAFHLGELIGTNGMNMVYGGAKCGLMGAAADGALKSGATVTGVWPGGGQDSLVTSNWRNQKTPSTAKSVTGRGKQEFISTKSLEERKRTMIRMSDAVVALAGGIGTFDEIATAFEMSRGSNFGPELVLVNTDGFYDGLHVLLKRMYDDFMVGPPPENFAYFADDASDAMSHILSRLPSPTSTSTSTTTIASTPALPFAQSTKSKDIGN